eukprot:595604-Lingulodinium_polyedra.AAC.1
MLCLQTIPVVAARHAGVRLKVVYDYDEQSLPVFATIWECFRVLNLDFQWRVRFYTILDTA